MAVDLRIVVPNRPGTAAEMCDAIARAGVNIDGFCGDLRPGERWGYLHVLVEDGARARRAVEEIGFEVLHERRADIVEIENRPGALAELLRSYSERGINIESLYMSSRGWLVISTEEMLDERPGIKMGDAKYP
jgi:hypothetical protein